MFGGAHPARGLGQVAGHARDDPAVQFQRALADLRVRADLLDQDPPDRRRLAGHPGGTEQDMIEGGYSFTALKGTSFMDPQVIANTALP